MRKIPFTKMQGSGNDFVVIESHNVTTSQRHKELAVRICDRKFGIGADGVLLLGRARQADARMRIFNADGSEAEMCGNGARCAALYISRQSSAIRRQKKISLETKAGIIEAGIEGERVKIALSAPKDLKLDIPVHVRQKTYVVDYINTGVPHAVLEVDDLEHVPVRPIGRVIRHHEVFATAGTNVDFIKVKDAAALSIRTYERGVEDETLACGTGSVAGAIIAVLNHGKKSATRTSHRVTVQTRSGEILTVYFNISKSHISDVRLEGEASIVFRGEYLF